MAAEKNMGPLIGQRHIQAFLLFLSITVNYTAKFNASVAVVAMTNSETTNPNFPEFDWNEMERSYILSSFFWGYILTQFLGGWLCRRYGARLTMFVSTIGSALLALLPPFCVSWGGWQAYCTIRVGMGLFQGFLFPCIHAHLANWCPVNERNRLGAFANTGIDCGTLMAMFLSGKIAASSMGWPGIFYISSTVGIIWCIVWLIFGANTPRESKFISEAELKYIESSINQGGKENEVQNARQIPVPWKAIFTSLPFWALMVARCSQAWGYSTLQTEMPTYMNGVLLMDMKSNAVYSALPYLASWIMAFVYLIISDILLNRGVLSITAVRKSFNTISFWVPAITLIGVGFVDSSQTTLAIVLMTLNVGINSGNTIGSAINTIDLSPNHAGILMGIVNSAANMLPMITPLFVGIIVKDQHDRVQWQVVFIISAIVFFLGNLFYIMFGKMAKQPWDDSDFLDNYQTCRIAEDGQSKREKAEKPIK
ncbi:putative inorganic phosphate cotransporter [Scaptodrosophila lebanonensis]|uniref:Putative inorganic phosphate cotransporter n=1 Tax=Drosophila lebanonensis TaxID=7225 RepID=A0A6J2U6S9_DROLE|nr:putative inorganic phosphate cotransporter [Scaptodrosophila lebanonensis]